MRGSALAILTVEDDSYLIPAAYMCALDGPLPEYVPPEWTGPHAGYRLVEAFRTLNAMPSMRAFGNLGYWPQYAYEFSDLVAQREMALDEREKEERAKNRVRLLPTAQAISWMEAAIVWPARYLQARPILRRVVLRVAALRARNHSLHSVARKLRKPLAQVRRQNREALDEIAHGLRRECVQVF